MIYWSTGLIGGIAGMGLASISGLWIVTRKLRRHQVPWWSIIGACLLFAVSLVVTLCSPSQEIVTKVSSSGMDSD